MYYSAENKWPYILSKLLDKRVNVNALTESETAFCTACREGHESIVRLLLHNGADPNVPGDFGRTALHCAVNRYQYCNSDIVMSLLNAGANVNVVNDEGENIVCYAGQSLIDISCHSHSTEEIFTTFVSFADPV